MPNGVRVASNKRKRAWFAVAFAVALGFAIARLRFFTGSEPLIGVALAFSLVGCGLWTLFQLAAYGPKTEEQGARRIADAGIGAGCVLFGTSDLVANSGLKLGVSLCALLVMLLSRVMSPRAPLHPPAEGPTSRG